MPLPVLQISYTLDNIENAVHQFWQYAHQYRILAFSGEMGAGKTTFIRTLCDYLSVADTVSSPTFALINEYHFLQNNADRTIYHMDWYRLNNEDEVVQAGMEDCLMQKGAYCFVEWPEKAPVLLRKPYMLIKIEVISPAERHMNVWLEA